MTEQKQTKKQDRRQDKRQQEQKQIQESEQLQSTGEEQVEKAAEDRKAAGDIIDDILADFTHTKDQPKVIGASKRLQLRQVSNEEFVGVFVQKGGE